jgi:hypothetical protein
MNAKIALLVNSCDLYEDAWDSFFSLLKIQWPDCPCDIYLNTENKNYKCQFLNVKTIKTGNNVFWTNRVKKALDEIDADYILFMLEDFFMLEQVNKTKFEVVVSEMGNESDVGFIFFPPRGVKYDMEYKLGTTFTNVDRYADYRVNACLGLWRKEFLLQMLYLDGNPWEFEHNATRLSWLSKYRCCVANPEFSSIFSYSILLSEGYGITQRKWLPKNKELFDKYNINVNFDNLGFLEKTSSTDKNQSREKDKKSKKQTAILRRLRKYKKRLKKWFRYLKDLLFIKSAFGRYCMTINTK